MRIPILCAVLACAFVWTPSAWASPTVGECLGATESFLKLRTDHKLRAAREQLLVCSADSCPAEMREECVHRLDEVSAALPTVVFTVKNGFGQELSKVKVTMDGEVVATSLDGGAITLDPGNHEFRFEIEGQPATTETLLLHEGEKGRHEAVTIGPVVSAPPPHEETLPPAVPTAPAASASVAAPVPGTPSTGGIGTVKAVALVGGGVGVASLITGGVLGLLAASSWVTAQQECPDPRMGCGTQAIDHQRSASGLATGSTIAFVAGGVLAVGGVTLFLLAGNGASRSVGLQLRPAGLALTGSF
jgi:hypothetical protein